MNGLILAIAPLVNGHRQRRSQERDNADDSRTRKIRGGICYQ
jgi:hypothetical protein